MAGGLERKVMDIIKHIAKKYNVDVSTDQVKLPIGRMRDMTKLFAELGLNKGAEIGVYRGTYSDALLKHNPKLHLTGVDSWAVYPGYRDFQVNDIADAYIAAQEMYKKYADRATLIKGWSREVAAQIPDESLDFIYIDANHDYPHAVEDLAAWVPKVRKGGVVAGHDYDDFSRTSRWYDMHVLYALDGWVKSYKIKPLFLTSNNTATSWMYVK